MVTGVFLKVQPYNIHAIWFVTLPKCSLYFFWWNREVSRSMKVTSASLKMSSHWGIIDLPKHIAQKLEIGVSGHTWDLCSAGRDHGKDSVPLTEQPDNRWVSGTVGFLNKTFPHDLRKGWENPDILARYISPIGLSFLLYHDILDYISLFDLFNGGQDFLKARAIP